jgi:hypothetical protein
VREAGGVANGLETLDVARVGGYVALSAADIPGDKVRNFYFMT